MLARPDTMIRGRFCVNDVSLTSPRAYRISGPEKFCSSARTTFSTVSAETDLAVPRHFDVCFVGKAEIRWKRRHFLFDPKPRRLCINRDSQRRPASPTGCLRGDGSLDVGAQSKEWSTIVWSLDAGVAHFVFSLMTKSFHDPEHFLHCGLPVVLIIFAFA